MDARRSLHGDRPHTGLAASLNNLAGGLEEAGRFADAEPLYLESLEMRIALHEPTHPSVLALRNNLAGLAMRTGEPERAAAEYADLVAIMRSEDFPPMRLAQVLSSHGMALVRAERIEEALPSLRESEAIIAREMGPEHVLRASSEPGRRLCPAGAGMRSDCIARRWPSAREDSRRIIRAWRSP